jgi:hypothetical protein
MSNVCEVGANAHAPCPKCGHQAIFFVKGDGDFMSGVRRYSSDDLVTLECRVDGPFEVRASDLKDRLI